MAIAEQIIADRYALYLGDCLEVLPKMPAESVHLSLYSPPFAGLYHYSSSERDMSNCRSYEEFMRHYEFLVTEMARVTRPGRITAVHCMDVPSGNTGRDHMVDFPGDIIRLHERCGWKYVARYAIWKDPFVVYIRTLAKNLRHRTCVDDSSRCSAAAADYLVVLRRDGENREPIKHPAGLMSYAGSREPPHEVLKYRGWQGKQTENRYSQWIWRQYASAFWDDVRLDRVLPYQEAKDPEDERHVHPLQLDVIERALVLWSNPEDTVLTPFMGVGSEVYGAFINGRRAVGVELKPTYYRQAVLNMRSACDAGGGVDATGSRQMSFLQGAAAADAHEERTRSAAATCTGQGELLRGGSCCD
jgi:DNA modification methylase